MMWGYQHRTFNAFIYIITVSFFIYLMVNTPSFMNVFFTYGMWDNYLIEHNFQIGFNYILPIWFILYTITFYFFTVISPDIDTESSASHSLGILGNLTSWLLPHRGPTHNLWIVTVVFGIPSLLIGTWFIAAWIAWVSHILTDRGSTGWKRVNPF